MRGMYVFVLVGALCFFGSTCGYPSLGDPVEEAREIVSNANKYIAKKNLTKIVTPDASFDYIIDEGYITNGRLEDLSTFYVIGEDQSINRTDNNTIHFKLKVGLGQFLFSYDFRYRHLLFTGEGHAEIVARTNEGILAGTVTRHQDGKCTATLETAEFTKLSDFRSTITPKNLLNDIVAKIIEFAKNNLFPSDVLTFNTIISKQSTTKAFKKTFSQVACHSFK